MTTRPPKAPDQLALKLTNAQQKKLIWALLDGAVYEDRPTDRRPLATLVSLGLLFPTVDVDEEKCFRLTAKGEAYLRWTNRGGTKILRVVARGVRE